MKEKAQLWADQTLNTALLYGLTREALASVAHILSAAGMDWFDLQLAALRKYPYPASELTFNGKARCIIDASLEQVEYAWQAGFRHLVVAYTVQRWRENRQDLELVLAAAQGRDLKVTLHVVNASELEADDIRLFFPLLAEYTVKSLVIGDRDSRLEPLRTFELLARLSADAPCALGFHAHNSYGLATANAFAALRGGASELAVSVAGVGNCGHAAMEEVMLGAQCLAGREVTLSRTLATDAAAVLTYLGLMTPPNKAVIGEHIFSHESGIHVNGMTKDHRLYEAFAPETVGLTRRMVIGKHSGTTSIKMKVDEWGLSLGERAARQLLKKVRRLAVAKKGIVDDRQLKRMFYRMQRRNSMRMTPKGGAGI